jgi:hypothetical protein
MTKLEVLYSLAYGCFGLVIILAVGYIALMNYLQDKRYNLKKVK